MQPHPVIFILKFVGLSSLKKSGYVKLYISIKIMLSNFFLLQCDLRCLLHSCVAIDVGRTNGCDLMVMYICA